MDRSSYSQSFTAERVPAWMCPACHVGHLELVPSSMSKHETAASRRHINHADWEPDWTRYVFSCVFKCSRDNCGELISCCGRGGIAYVEGYDDEYGPVQVVEDELTPRYFHPSLVLLDIPKSCAASVAAHLRASFALFFADPGAALNCARAAVEALLTDLGVKRYVITAGKKRRSLSLHSRLQALPPACQGLADMLIAVKWLGNTGSHDGPNPTAAEVLVTYELLEHVLSEIYDNKTKALKAAAKKINKSKGKKISK